MPVLIRELIGQKQAVDLLKQSVNKQHIAPAYLFAGPNGVGKSLTAQYFSKSLLGLDLNASLINHPDFLSIEPSYLVSGKLLNAQEAEASGVKRKAPPSIKIEQIREITHFLSRPPLKAPRSVVVINEAQTMAESAANALLKTLEEPGRATLILIAPSADSLLPTLVSRCQYIPFHRLCELDLQEVLREKGYEALGDNSLLISLAQGSPGEAIFGYQKFKNIDRDLLKKLKQSIAHPLDAFTIAKEITTDLDNETQLWLIDYLQYFYWQKELNPQKIKELEQGKKLLLKFVQPRLVWECMLMKLICN